MAYTERTGEQGASENGQALTVIGDMLTKGAVIPSSILYRYNPKEGRIVNITLDSLPKAGFLIYTANTFTSAESFVCRREAEDCDRMVSKKAKELLIPLLGVSNDDPVELYDWQQQAGIQNHTLYTGGPDFGRDWGVHIKEYKGQYQRGLFPVVNGRITIAEYVFDQGGDLPDFDEAFKAIEQARRDPNSL